MAIIHFTETYPRTGTIYGLKGAFGSRCIAGLSESFPSLIPTKVPELIAGFSMLIASALSFILPK